ncbi:DUF4304 domain-containing protein [Sphingobacterium hungaricum]
MKEKFNQLIGETVNPLLKANGFSKKGLNFYRKSDELIFLFNFQKSQGNTSEQTKFYINCGIHSIKIDKEIGKTALIEPKEYECYFRRRISSITNSINDGYLINQEADLSKVSLIISNDLKTVISFFDKIQSTHDLTDLMISKNGLNNYRQLFEYLLLTESNEDLKLFVNQLHKTFGKDKRWRIFESNMNELLNKNNVELTVEEIIVDKSS